MNKKLADKIRSGQMTLDEFPESVMAEVEKELGDE